MGKRSKIFLLLTGIMAFMIVFPTTFWVLLDGATILQKIFRQIYSSLNF